MGVRRRGREKKGQGSNKAMYWEPWESAHTKRWQGERRSQNGAA